MPKDAGTKISGPIRSKAGRSTSITVAALTTNTAETYSITDSDAKVGDVICVSPQTAPEAGWGIEAAWCDTAGTIKVRARNHSGSSLTGGALVVSYSISR